MKTVLLIEDDNILRENTAELLELSGYDVITAPNGKIGIATVKEKKPHIIVCDIMMPEVDGYGVLDALSSDESTQNIPFIFLSAITEHKAIRKGMDLGADDYLTKPFEEEDLVSAIESRLAKSKLLHQLKTNTTEEVNDPDAIGNLNQLKNYFDDHGEIIKMNEGETIYEEGVRSTYVYLILKGAVKCHTMDQDGKELITTLYHADDFLGFTSLMNNSVNQESATALEQVELAAVSKEHLHQIVAENHTIPLELMTLLSDNISEIKHQLLQMAYSSVRKKTAQTLLQFAEIMNNDASKPIRISRADLASVAGIATESLIRTLSSFKKEGLIEIEGRNIRIKELKVLQYVT
ncbi:response regulator [Maribacter sp. MAR_2009_72]|uniref:response regulator n=1 Tax=Maribacter sp. MAR_2009_72 TaxID=1250050 RepID=UPI00119A3982|nr:response regulator [Maribacter sp. MAR_2009_72]TVZ14758.1 CRP-like cAMP-binding protein [Maribacter sp. MAR_2009_72]